MKISKKDIILIVVLIISILLNILLISYISISNASKKVSKNIDASTMLDSELVQMFKDEGYEISMTRFSSADYIVLSNEANGVNIQRVYTKYIGTLMTYYNKTINDKMADLINFTDNDTEEKKQQYENFQDWQKYYNISLSQLSEFLDNYYKNNQDSIVYIDEYNILNYKMRKNKARIIDKFIFMNYSNINTYTEEKCLLAEELGHYYYDAYYTLSSSKYEIERQEYKANKWMSLACVPLNSILSCFKKGIYNLFDIAEELNVKPNMVKFAYNYYLDNGKLNTNDKC